MADYRYPILAQSPLVGVQRGGPRGLLSETNCQNRSGVVRIPDPIEQGESRMERWFGDHVNGTRWLCDGCGKWRDTDDMHQATPNPYSQPICGECAFGPKGDA